MKELTSQIVITHEPTIFIEELQEQIPPERLIVIECDEFKVEDAKEATRYAYVASKEERYIVLNARKYNIYAQNAMLKILEEPPPKTHFILIAPAKSILLPTILSRLPIYIVDGGSGEESYTFDSFDLEVLYNLIKKSRELSKFQGKAIIRGMLEYALKKGYRLDTNELEFFGRAIELIELNSNLANIFTTAGLILLGHQKRGA